MGFIHHDLGKVMNNLRVRKVFALGGGRHHKVVLHQPHDQAGIPSGQLVANAERFGIHGANLGVIAMTALTNVVVEPGQVDQLRFGQLGHQFAG